MSKSLKNYPDPNIVVDKYGADALRLFLINSPVVRGDNLRFREAGVREVISRVLAPWLNSFRFFLGQCILLEKETGIKYRYDHDAPKSANVMDRWILARCQSLIQLVHSEMEVYRLYTVVPRLLDLIDELTNWYIRFNRRRLKGESGSEDTLAALNSFFETLLTLCRTLVCMNPRLAKSDRALIRYYFWQTSFTPFLAENIYQSLRPLLPEDTSALDMGEDLRSIHFLPFPHPRKEYFDPVIERQVQRMQSVIILGRALRDKHTLPIKVSYS